MFINFILSAAAVINSNDDIQKHLQKINYEKFQVNVEYEYHEEGADTTKGEHGTLSVNKNKYRLSFQGRDIICNGSTMWNFDKNTNSVTITKEIDEEDNPLLLLTNYKKKFHPQARTKKNNLYIITMLPNNEDEDNEVKYFEILCDDDFIYQLNIFNEDDSWISIRLTQWNIKVNFANNFFSFDPKKQNIKVVNLD